MSARMMTVAVGAAVMTAWICNPQGYVAAALEPGHTKLLAEEVRGKGWIAYSSRSEKGDWDLFLCRPDGSEVRNITRTPEYNEALPQFSRDGRRLMYRRLKRNESIHPNHHGTQGELVFANSDGSNPTVYGQAGEYPWASWSPDGKQIASLSIKGISIIDIDSKRALRTMERKGFFQQLTWSPDGQWLSGVANSFGTGWSIARMNIKTGETNAVSRVDCCTPDWFPDSRQLIFSNRPRGQKANEGYGWTQLWMADAEGKQRQPVYAEDGRHVYGGHVSPDGKYILFTGNMKEDGDPGEAGSPMGLMRLTDAPIVGGSGGEVREMYPQAKSGPVLVLPVGFEPSWTFAEFPGRSNPQPAIDPVAELAKEVRDKGWIIFSAPSGQGDWDLYAIRPDGSDRRQVTDTREYHEAGPRFSPDGNRLLYYRIPRSQAVDNNTYGTYELVIANSGGTNAVVYGKEFPWTSWGPDGKQVACLAKNGIQIVDLATRQVVRQLPRKGIVQQLVWSADGEWFVGTANGLGPFWNIGCLNAKTGQIKAISETERYNCTPDWLADSQRVIYARGIVPNTGGCAELWLANRDGTGRQLLYVEEGRHIYGGCASPDGKYMLFTRSEADLGKVDNSQTSMAMIRLADAPMALGDAVRSKHPAARTGPRLDLSWGWEPHWTYTDVFRRTSQGSGN